jgi:hypothetical protein
MPASFADILRARVDADLDAVMAHLDAISHRQDQIAEQLHERLSGLEAQLAKALR